MLLKNKNLNKNLKILSEKYFELKKKDGNDFLKVLDDLEEYKKVIDILDLAGVYHEIVKNPCFYAGF